MAIKKLEGSKGKSKMAESMREFKEAFPYMMEHTILSAKLYRAKYLALKEEGFTSEEALELCKNL